MQVQYETEVPAKYRKAFARPADQFDPAAAAASIIRDMPDPTAEQVQMVLSALISRLTEMDGRGYYDGVEVVTDHLLSAHGAADAVVCHTDGRSL